VTRVLLYNHILLGG